MNKEIIDIIKRALKEDIPTIDVSSEYLFENEQSEGLFIAKEDGVISGVDVCMETFKIIHETVIFTILKHNRSFVKKGEVIAKETGNKK